MKLNFTRPLELIFITFFYSNIIEKQSNAFNHISWFSQSTAFLSVGWYRYRHERNDGFGLSHYLQFCEVISGTVPGSTDQNILIAKTWGDQFSISCLQRPGWEIHPPAKGDGKVCHMYQSSQTQHVIFPLQQELKMLGKPLANICFVINSFCLHL